MLTFLWLPLALATLATLASSERNPLCERAMAGTFNGTLISTTWRGTDTVDFVFSNFVKVKPGAIERDQIFLQQTSQWSEEEYQNQFYDTWKLPREGQLKTFYELCLPGIYRAQVLVDTTLYIFSTGTFGSNRPELVVPQIYVPYSVVFEQRTAGPFSNYQLNGYVIMRDKAGEMIILDLTFYEAEFLQPIVEKEQFYYLSSENLKQLNLVHRRNRKTANLKPLFSQRPSGFIKGGLMHLFDDQLGCVRIVNIGTIRLDSKFDDAGMGTLNFDMDNVPYEKYFKCPEEFKPSPGLDPSRCDREVPTLTPTLYPPPTGSNATTANSTTAAAAWLNETHLQIIAASLSALLLACCGLVFCCAKSKKKTSARKNAGSYMQAIMNWTPGPQGGAFSWPMQPRTGSKSKTTPTRSAVSLNSRGIKHFSGVTSQVSQQTSRTPSRHSQNVSCTSSTSPKQPPTSMSPASKARHGTAATVSKASSASKHSHNTGAKPNSRSPTSTATSRVHAASAFSNAVSTTINRSSAISPKATLSPGGHKTPLSKAKRT